MDNDKLSELECKKDLLKQKLNSINIKIKTMSNQITDTKIEEDKYYIEHVNSINEKERLITTKDKLLRETERLRKNIKDTENVLNTMGQRESLSLINSRIAEIKNEIIEINNTLELKNAKIKKDTSHNLEEIMNKINELNLEVTTKEKKVLINEKYRMQKSSELLQN